MENGNIHRAITVPVNEVYMKASSELMKNSDFGIHVEQLDSLIRERTRRAHGLTKVISTEGNSLLGCPFLGSGSHYCPGRSRVW